VFYLDFDNKALDKYLVEVKRVEESRGKGADKEIRSLYKSLLKKLNSFIGEYYTKYSDDNGVLNVAILQQNAKYASFLEEVDKNIKEVTPAISKTIKSTVEKTYKACFEGMINGFSNSAGDSKFKDSFNGLSIKPEVLKAAVENPISGLTLPERLQKHRQDVIYDIRQSISNSLMTGERFDTTSKKLVERLDVSYGKASSIVRTESHRVQEKGLMDGAEHINDKVKGDGLVYAAIWHNLGDEKVRPNIRVKTKKGWKTYKSHTNANHKKMEGQLIESGGYFDLGNGIKAKSPGESGDASNDCNCRCFVEYEMMTVEEFEERGGKWKNSVNVRHNETQQNYKPVIKDTNNQNIMRRNCKDIQISKLTNTKNKVYISDNAKIKPKQQQELDRNITAVLNMLNIKDKSVQPIVAILSDYEMSNNAVASYNPIQNVVYVRQTLLEYTKLSVLQEQLACPENKYSTLLHEYIHWLDAENYRSKNSDFSNIDDYNKYIKYLRTKCKTKLDKAGVDNYNIGEISYYAKVKYISEEYDEAYTEYRVQEILRK
jgi:hypothetical protein